MKDLGELYYFLGIQLQCNSMCIFVSQQKYVDDLLHKFHIHTIKFVTPLSAARTLLFLTDSELLADPTQYWSMVGVLQYLTMTYRTTHLHDVKRIFRYL